MRGSIDPPPPIEAAGSSLLYSEEFYAVAKAHLNPNGILATWVPSGSPESLQAVFRSLVNSFKFVRCFVSIGDLGVHVLASEDPIPNVSSKQIAAQLPAAAASDLLEWTPSKDVDSYVNELMSKEVRVESLLNPDPSVRITDDHPYNEYYFVRHHAH